MVLVDMTDKDVNEFILKNMQAVNFASKSTIKIGGEA